ncbi:hypothetical protein m07a_02060 [Bartonella schoenbuchensis m07a]|uniref:Right handed beta helix domain-containing protein n=2 Tax=Bartonella schoenbuchensis TaxID=165694 RepID=N6UFL7_9HYPH|nr:hypothetical protein m07a_02060 [Bartonella schoenbuchensis m07a]
MVMRCVLKHHVCLCVLSTAVLAGLTLITAQTKVYAQSKNCNGFTNPGATGEPGGRKGDNPNGKIECDGGYGGTGGNGDRNGQLGGERTIDMDTDPKPAVKVHKGADITINSKLTVTDSKSKSTSPAIQVESGGVLRLSGHVTIQNVKKGIEVGQGSSVTVLKGSIGVRAGGGAVIEVQNGGEVTLSRGVTVEKVSGTGEVISINNGGNVMLGGTRFMGVNKGIVFKGSKGTANATVMGVGGATINLAHGGTGVIMEGREGANATVMELNIKGSGGTTTGAEVTGEGTLVLNKVKISQVQMGAKVTKGKLTVTGGINDYGR